MPGAEGVVLAFVATREAADTAELAQAVHALAPAGQHLVRVGLVAHVPDHAVVGRVEDVVQRHRQLHRAQVAAQVAAGLADALQHEVAQLDGQRLEFGPRHAPQRRPDCRSVSSRELVSSAVHFGQLSRSTTMSASCASVAVPARPLRRSASCARSRNSIGLAARRLQAEHRHIGGLVGVQVLAGRLAQRVRFLRHVEDVVDHLEGQAERRAIVGQCLPGAWLAVGRRPRPSARWPAAARRSCAGACRAAHVRPAACRCWPGRWPGHRPCRHGRPNAPAGAHRRACSAGSTPASGVSTSKASACIASPASMAWAWP